MSVTSVGEAKVSVSVEEHVHDSLKFLRVNVRNSLRAMAEATLQRSRMLAPELTGSLKADGRVEEAGENELEVSVAYGSPAVPYARRRHFENNLHPDTKYYLQNAGDTVAKEGISKYL